MGSVPKPKPPSTTRDSSLTSELSPPLPSPLLRPSPPLPSVPSTIATSTSSSSSPTLASSPAWYLSTVLTALSLPVPSPTPSLDNSTPPEVSSDTRCPLSREPTNSSSSSSR